MTMYLNEQIEDARERVAFCRMKAERPQARLEEAYALEKARNRLLTLEMKALKQTAAKGGVALARGPKTDHRKGSQRKRMIGTKSEQITLSKKQNAERAFSELTMKSFQGKDGK